jgi:uncharacterized membrane protein YccC
VPGTLSAARERITSYLEPHSVWLHNSLRGAAGLGLAVLAARLTEVQHSFWVVLGALSVLRSNALTGWRIGLARLEDVAIGVRVSLVVGVLFWPRGAAPALRRALAEAYADGAGYFASTVRFARRAATKARPHSPRWSATTPGPLRHRVGSMTRSAPTSPSGRIIPPLPGRFLALFR